MADLGGVPERPFGAVKKTEEELQAVPIPRQQSAQPPAPPQAQEQPTNVTDEGGAYATDILADSPMATLPPDIQNKLTAAQRWYEIAVHPAATQFERELAMAHLNDMDTPTPEEVEAEKKDTSGDSS